MSLPEGYLPRRGDEILIRVRALHDARTDETDSMVHVEVVGNEHRKLFVDLDNIHSLYCRKWNEGDKVTCKGEFEGHGTVISTHADSVWVEQDGGDCDGLLWTCEANGLEPYVEPLEKMTEAELLDGLAPLLPPEPIRCRGSQSDIGDGEEIGIVIND